MSACLSACLSMSVRPPVPPSHNPESDEGGNVDFSAVGIGSAERASENYNTESLKMVFPRLRDPASRRRGEFSQPVGQIVSAISVHCTVQ